MPRLLLCDEPTAACDLETDRQIHQTLLKDLDKEMLGLERAHHQPKKIQNMCKKTQHGNELVVGSVQLVGVDESFSL